MSALADQVRKGRRGSKAQPVGRFCSFKCDNLRCRAVVSSTARCC